MFIQFAFLLWVLLSLRLRVLGNLKAHAYTMLAAVVFFVVSFISVLLVFPNDPMFTTHPEVTLASPLLTAVFGVHLFLALLSVGSGAGLVVLWFLKKDFMTRSKIPAVLTEVGWLSAFAIGLYLFIALNV